MNPRYPSPFHRSAVNPPRIRNRRGNPLAIAENTKDHGTSVVVEDLAAKTRHLRGDKRAIAGKSA